jgi:hypothetical protein
VTGPIPLLAGKLTFREGVVHAAVVEAGRMKVTMNELVCPGAREPGEGVTLLIA